MSVAGSNSNLIANIESFKYSELNREGHEIRLVRILPREASGEVEFQVWCEVFHANLENAPIYDALSYTWGTADPQHSILLNGRSFQVRDNLWTALRRLQSDVEELIIWIDAICIDQENIAERNHQVKNMRAIYERAARVLVWLGQSYDDSGIALELVNDLYQHSGSESWISQRLKHPEISRQLKALGRLFARPYWYRIWIVQEITLAKTVTVYCGESSISGAILSDVQGLLSNRTYAYSLIIATLADDPLSQDAIVWSGPKSIETSRRGFLSKSLSLFEALEYHFQKRASDPKDMIYGLLSLTNVVENQNFEVNYSHEVAQVYTDFVMFEIRTSGRLDIVTKALRGASEKGVLPSWVPDWSELPPGHAFLQSIFQPEHRFAAAGTSKAEVIFTSERGVMIIKGFNIAFIKTVGEYTHMENRQDLKHGVVAFHKWRGLLEAVAGEKYAKQEAFGRTLTFNVIKAQAIDPNSLWESCRAILGAFATLSVAVCPDQPIDALLKEFMSYKFGLPPEEYETWRREWILSVMYRIWDRRFFVTSLDGMGIAPESVLTGDIICIPLGCSAPLILRPAADHYIVIGEAYVDGFMYGKAMELLAQGKLEIQDFELY